MNVMICKALIELIILTTPSIEVIGEPVDLEKLFPGNSKGSTNQLLIRQIVTKLIQAGCPEERDENDDCNENVLHVPGLGEADVVITTSQREQVNIMEDEAIT